MVQRAVRLGEPARTTQAAGSKNVPQSNKSAEASLWPLSECLRLWATIRKWLRQQCEEHSIQAKLPPEIQIGEKELLKFGLDQQFATGVQTAQDLYHKLRDLRDAIAHFLIERDGADIHVYLAEGAQLYVYSTAAAALLHYAHLSLESLRMFYTQNVGQRGSHILPMVQYRDQLIVRASALDLE
jgi:hypothetical protein